MLPAWLRGPVAVANPRRVWLVTGAHAVNEFYSVALPPILPLLVADLAISYGQAGALLAVFYAMYSVFQLPAGGLADRVGKRPVLAGGMVVLAAGVFLAGLAGDYATLVAAQALAGVGGSTYHPAGMSLISDLETGGTEGKAMGIHGLGGVAGTALAPAVIGGLAVLFDWRLALLAGAGVGVVYAAVFLVAMPAAGDGRSGEAGEPTPDGGRADDGGPAGHDGEADVCHDAGHDGEADVCRDAGHDGEADVGRASGGADDASVGGGRHGRPTGFADRVARLLNVPLAWWVGGLFVANLLISLEIGAIRTFATAYLFARTGGSTAVSNAVFFVMLAGGGVASLGAGHLADRVDRRALGVGVLVLSAVALWATTLVPAAPLVLTAWFFVLGLVVYAVLPAMNALTSAYAERGFSGSLFGVMLTAGALGGAGGPLLFGVVAERLGPAVAFPLVAVVSLAGALAFLGLYRV